MADQLDALVDRIRRLSAAERRRPTADEAREVGRLALRLASEKLPTDGQPALSKLPLAPVAAAAALPADLMRKINPYACGTLAPAAGCSGSGGGCEATSLDDELNERLQQLRPSRPDARQHGATVKALCNEVLHGLKARYPRTFRWRIYNSGSYFDKTKVVPLIHLPIALSNFQYFRISKTLEEGRLKPTRMLS